MNNINLIKTLCFGGLIPFYFLSIITVFNFNFLFVDLFSLYSLVILTFLSGSTWYHLIIVEKKDAYSTLNATISFYKGKRLVLIDPSYEVKDEYEKVVKLIKHNTSQFSDVSKSCFDNIST